MQWVGKARDAGERNGRLGLTVLTVCTMLATVTQALLATDTQVSQATIMSQVTPFNRNLQTGAPAHL